MTKVLDTIVILVLKNSVVFTRYNVIKVYITFTTRNYNF